MKKTIAGLAAAALTAAGAAAATCAAQADTAAPARDTADREQVASVTPSLCYAQQEDGTGFCVDRSICSGGCFHGDGTEAAPPKKWYELDQ